MEKIYWQNWPLAVRDSYDCPTNLMCGSFIFLKAQSNNNQPDKDSSEDMFLYETQLENWKSYNA